MNLKTVYTYGDFLLVFEPVQIVVLQHKVALLPGGDHALG